MPAPQIRVFVDFDSDTAFEINPLILDSATEGILGTNTLGSGTLPIEITSLVERVSIRRGRSRITSQFEAGTASVTLFDQTGDWNPTNPARVKFISCLMVGHAHLSKAHKLRVLQLWQAN